MARFTVVTIESESNGFFRSRLDDENGRVLKVGPEKSSQAEAVVALVRVEPEFFNIAAFLELVIGEKQGSDDERGVITN